MSGPAGWWAGPDVALNESLPDREVTRGVGNGSSQAISFRVYLLCRVGAARAGGSAAGDGWRLPYGRFGQLLDSSQ
jgi:hypothetical protein